MITLITGVNGAGKTLNLIAALRALNQRTVYYNHIDGVQVSAWHPIDDDQVLNWQALPDGAVVAVDEAHRLFPQRTRAPVPEFIARLDEHRHRGFDFFLVTQHPKKIDVEVRRLCGQHWHFERKFGAHLVRRFTWQRACDDVNDRRERRQAVITTERLDKTLFALYHSAELHTHRFRVPAKVLLGALAVVVLLALVVAIFSRFITAFGPADAGAGSAAVPEETLLEAAWREAAVRPNAGSGQGAGPAVPETPGFVTGFGGFEPSLMTLGYTQLGPVVDGQPPPKRYHVDYGGARLSARDLAFLGWSLVEVSDCLLVARLPGGGQWLATCASPPEPLSPSTDPVPGGAGAQDAETPQRAPPAF